MKRTCFRTAALIGLAAFVIVLTLGGGHLADAQSPLAQPTPCPTGTANADEIAIMMDCIGNLMGMAGADTLMNMPSSTIFGGIDGGSGNDSIINSGVITGGISGGDGNDVIIITGVVEGTVSGDAGADTLASTGTTGALVDGQGANLIVQGRGAITGYIVTNPLSRVINAGLAAGVITDIETFLARMRILYRSIPLVQR